MKFYFTSVVKRLSKIAHRSFGLITRQSLGKSRANKLKKLFEHIDFKMNASDLIKYIPLFFFLISSAFAAEKNPVPRFVSLRPNEVNARVGPGPDYPVEWVYLKAGFPVEVTAEFDTWRKIRDVEGAESWVHQSMLSAKRHALIQKAEALMYPTDSNKSPPLVRLQPGVVVELLKCRGDWCQVRIFDFKGWIQRAFLWGLYPNETFG